MHAGVAWPGPLVSHSCTTRAVDAATGTLSEARSHRVQEPHCYLQTVWMEGMRCTTWEFEALVAWRAAQSPCDADARQTHAFVCLASHEVLVPSARRASPLAQAPESRAKACAKGCLCGACCAREGAKLASCARAPRRLHKAGEQPRRASHAVTHSAGLTPSLGGRADCGPPGPGLV
jgi:hypothetical protein